MFTLVHAIHITAAALALTVFVWRGWRMWCGELPTAVLWRRIVPDSIDTLLLITGVTMMVMLGQYPLQQAWLTAKLSAVVIYIALGFVAFRGRGARLPRIAWLLALLVFAYVVMVAHTRNAWPFVVLGG